MVRSRAFALASLLSVAFLGAVLLAGDDREHRSSRLTPPEGATQPNARGVVVLSDAALVVKVEGLAAGDYKVCLDDGTGTLAPIGTLSVTSENDDEEDDGGDKPDGEEGHGGGDGEHDGIDSAGYLKLGADAVPFGAANWSALAGRAIAVKGADGATVLAGKTPAVIVEEPEEHVGDCPLARPEGAADTDASGNVKVESREGRIVIKVKVRHLAVGAVLNITLTNPAEGGATEALGSVTINEEGNGQFKLDTANGDAVPFGALDLAALLGFKVEVKNAEGVVVLTGKICAAEIREDGEEHGADEPCEANLARPDPAPDADATGEVEIEGEELEVEVERLAPGTSYDVVLIQPGEGGASATIGQVKTGERGSSNTEFTAGEGVVLPFGKTKISELVGLGVEIRDPAGAVVLKGAIPEMACAAEKEDGDGHDDDGDDGDGDKPPIGANEPCEADLARPDPAPDADALGEVEIEGEELEVELARLAPGTTYDVVVIQPGEGGASATLGQIKTGEVGRAESEFTAGEGVVLPFGKTKISELVGHGIQIRDAAGVVVLAGTIPEITCKAEEDQRDGGDKPDQPAGGGVAEPIEPIFVLLGRFDAQFLRGDANRDTTVDISDALFVLQYLFVSGTRPYCLDAADSSDDGQVDISDPIALLGHLFLGGSKPSAPGMSIPGSDPTSDSLYCEETQTP